MIDLTETQRIVVLPGRPQRLELSFLGFDTREVAREFAAAAHHAVTVAAGADDGSGAAVSVGLTAEGLRLLGVSSREWDALPLPFTAGMRAAAARLGDDPSPPEPWPPPFDGRSIVHAVVIRADDADLGPVAPIVSDRTVATWRAERRARDEEPFGFRDGISDPVIEGAGRPVTPGNGVWDDDRGEWRAVKAGEAVLGHVDESGGVSGHPDAAHLEVDGSYLVIRRLQQHVDLFEDACAAWATELGDGTTADEVAARLVGRRKDGTVLGRPGPDRGNDFRYRGEGNLRRSVPPSAHIRRANPRDDAVVAGGLVRRHQLFRRGLPYRDGEEQGTLFLACCADIARQFEFVQSQWMQDGARFGLGAERDPLIGERSAGGPAAKVSIDHRGRRVTRSLSTFVTMRGGEYVLLPSRSALGLLGQER